MNTTKKLVLSVTLWTLGSATAAAQTVTYGYDALDRLSSVASSAGYTITYSYDANGNRTQKVVTGGANTAPIAVNDSKTTPKNTVLSFDPRTNDSDPDGDPITITAKTNGAHGAVAITGGGTGRLQAERDILKITRLSQEEVLAQAGDLFGTWPDFTFEQRRQIVETICDRIVIGKEGVEISLLQDPFGTSDEMATPPRGFGPLRPHR